MFIYNITVKVSWGIHDSWLAWMKTERIPEMIKTKLFYQCQVVRLLEQDDTDGPTYALQYYTEKIENYQEYLAEFSGLHTAVSAKKWGIESLEFTTIMQIVY